MDKSRVLIYFDKHARNYDFRANSLPWGYIREIEKRGILELLNPSIKDIVLDAGSGSGFYANILKEIGCDVLAVDFSREMIKEVERKNIAAVNCDIENLKFGIFQRV